LRKEKGERRKEKREKRKEKIACTHCVVLELAEGFVRQ
jgi:hypothetical protein